MRMALADEVVASGSAYSMPSPVSQGLMRAARIRTTAALSTLASVPGRTQASGARGCAVQGRLVLTAGAGERDHVRGGMRAD